MGYWGRGEGLRQRVLVLGWVLAGTLGAEPPRDVRGFFAKVCAACHGPDGSGRAITGQRLPGRALNDARWMAREKDEDLVKVILKGRAAMPGYRGLLTEDEVRRMVTEVIRPLSLKKK